jgi:hypothetical protein
MRNAAAATEGRRNPDLIVRMRFWICPEPPGEQLRSGSTATLPRADQVIE